MNQRVEPDQPNADCSSDFLPVDDSGVLSWVHFGDLHLTHGYLENYGHLLRLIDAARDHLSWGVNFLFLPGDNANEAEKSQYGLLRSALARLQNSASQGPPLSRVLPCHAIPGDHDFHDENLDEYEALFGAPYKESTFGGCRFVFLNALDAKRGEKFGMQKDQLEFLKSAVFKAHTSGEKLVLFIHLYPSQLDGPANDQLAELIAQSDQLRVVEMGHTHYNEVANDGRVIYATTRSTGQIEEGPVGFSITCLDGDVVSWKFKELDSPWPFTMITSPADQAFQTLHAPPVRGPVTIRAKAWSQPGVDENGTLTPGIDKVWCRVDEGRYFQMNAVESSYPETGPHPSTWEYRWNPALVGDGIHRLTVWAVNREGLGGQDTINVLVDRAGTFQPRSPEPVDMENRLGPYPEKGIVGTLLGPNLHGHPW